MAYCTVAQARAQGCTGTDDEVTGYIAMAQGRVDEFTRQAWEPVTLTVIADLGPDGLALLPRRVRSITSVTPVAEAGAPAVLPASAWRATSSAVLGAVDAVRLDVGGWDDLVAGAESWAGGWAGLLDRWCADQVEVTGEFGWDGPPPAVQQATALVAAAVQQLVAPQQDGDPDAPGELDVDDEGNNVRITPADDETPSGQTTGSLQADALLAPAYVNAGLTLIGGV